MPITLRKTDIRDACGERAYVRGLDYARQNRVLDWSDTIGEHAIEIAARVRGSAVYRQQIVVRQFGTHREIDGECSCPVGYNCKHVASVLLAWHAARSDVDPAGERVQRWIDSLASLYDDRQPATTGHERPVLLYVLVSADADSRRIAVRLQGARLKPDGSARGRPVGLAVHDRGQPRLRQACRPVDDGILRLLASLPGEFAPLLHGELGALVLQRMLATGRLYWQDVHRSPLQPDGPRQGRLAWSYGDGSYRLGLATGADPLVPVLVDPPAYVDPAGRRLGPLQLDPALDGRLLAALMDAPAIPGNIARNVSRQLLRRLPEVRLPLPTDCPVDDIAGVLPTPVLRLAAGDGGPGTRGHRVELAFDYAGHRVGSPFRPFTQFAEGERVVRIRRNAEAERAAATRLADMGFAVSVAGDAPGPRSLPRDEATAAAGGGPDMDAWCGLLRHGVPALQADGWIVERDADFDLRFSDADGLRIDARRADGWFDVGVSVEIDGRQVDLVPLLASLVEHIDDPDLLDPATPVLVEASPGHWLRLAGAQATRLLGALFDLLVRDARRPGRLVARRADAVRLAQLDASGIAWHGETELRDLARQLAAPPPVPRARDLKAELRPYQAQGVGWLQQRCALGMGCLLADDMGLGKTLQVLAHLQIEKEAGRLDAPALVVLPTSLVGNWVAEAGRFTPSLRVLVLHGARRKAHFDDIGGADIVLTTYPLLPRDEQPLAAHAYHSVILDEAQTIKNPRAKAAQSARRLDARHRVCLTGTPVENHLGDLWALFNFLSPGHLGNAQQFRQWFRLPIERDGHDHRRRLLQDRVAPFLLRRTKQAVAGELPDKVEIVRPVRFEPAQAALYESVRAAMDARVRDVMQRKGLDGGRVTVLDALLRLRQVCCDPRLLGSARAHGVEESAKLTLLAEMIPELVAEGRRILLFSQFTSMLALIEQEVRHRGIAYAKLTGRTRRRDAAIARFRSGEVPLFLISLKAGGVGLNLTEADTVIHYDPWWNPAVENQATDRAHRIGQTEKVFVYKLVVEQSVEEKILALQQRKAGLAAAIYRPQVRHGERGASDAPATFLSEADVVELLRPQGL